MPDPLIVIPTSIPGGPPARPPAHHTRRMLAGETMGTTWRADFFAAPETGNHEIRRAIERELEHLNAQMSHWRPDSNLTRFNQAPAGSWLDLPAEFFQVLASALNMREQTSGAFDPTLGALVDSWGFGPSRTPVTAPFAATHDSPGIQLDMLKRRARQPGGASVDLSAIAKGYAVDHLTHLLDQPGISSTLVEIGGELRARGVKSEGQPWWVAIECPPDGPASVFPEVRIALCGISVASSGDYRRYFEHHGARYSHTIDPRSGAPIRHPIASVTVLHERCMLADAYSTALNVMGPDEGLAFANEHDLAALYILRAGATYNSRSSRLFQKMLDVPSER